MPHHGQRVREKYMFEFRNLDYETTVVEDPITINTWYEAFPVTLDVKAYYLIVEQTNNGATNEDFDIELTINGIIYSGSRAAAVSGTPYYIVFSQTAGISATGTVFQILSLDADQSAPLETRSLGIRVRQTSVVDLVSAIIEVNLVYATLEET